MEAIETKGVGAALRDRPIVVAFSLSVLLSSLLLFLIEPMFAKMILPLLGGTPAVWNTAMLFFQLVLLAGYLYAHLSVGRLGIKRQVLLHACIAAVAVLILPVTVPNGWVPPTSGEVYWLLGLLTVGVGLPFFVLSSTAPLMQMWFSTTEHTRAEDPYFLYAASNVGSMVGLLAYPIVIEPRLALTSQSGWWSVGYWTFLAVMLTCAWVAVRSPASPAPVDIDLTGTGLGWTRRLKWLALAFVPSSLMLGVTNHLTTDLASIPLIWIVPLTLYLLSFVVVFSLRLGPAVHPIAVRAMPILLTGLAIVLFMEANSPLAFLALLNLGTFFAIALVCHGELARDTPEVGRLTEFYLWLAIGGALGGTFNALLAPLLFDSIAEYPIALVLACFLLPSKRSAPRVLAGRRWDLPIAGAIGLLALVLLVVLDADPVENPSGLQLAVIVPLVLTFLLRDNPVRYGLAVASVFLAVAIALEQGRTLFVERSFYGVHHVIQEGSYNSLVHGNTIHGKQSRDPARAEEPLTYYSTDGPLGTVFDQQIGINSAPRVGVIGLGTGAMACYAQPEQTWTYFEIDPIVEKMARDPRLFTYLDRCFHRGSVILGDGRLSVAEVENGTFGLLAVDAFSSDAIPVHLLTREAVSLYTDKLAPGGVLLFHISNRYVDLRLVLAAVAEEAGLVAFGGRDRILSETERTSGRLESWWVAMAPSAEDLEPLTSDERWTRLVSDPGSRAWTDDYSNVLSVLKWN